MDNLENLFNDSGTGNSEVLLELLKVHDIATKGNMSSRQLKSLFKLSLLEKTQNPENKHKNRLTLLKETYLEFLPFLVSKQGERAKQVTETLKEMRPDIEQEPLVSNLKQ